MRLQRVLFSVTEKVTKMRMNYDAPKPEIKVLHSNRPSLRCVVEQVINGIEEEGLPYSIEINEELNSVELAYRGAELSHLGVGIGVTEKEVVLHFIKLKENEPLFMIPSFSDEETLRALGSNAARIVKRMPFKTMANEELS